jgi:hypothetical protein
VFGFGKLGVYERAELAATTPDAPELAADKDATSITNKSSDKARFIVAP